jgi:predicted nuclease of predicted toxin-antitoxin system
VASPRILLDANISQKVARALWRELKLDVLSLRAQRLDDLPDGDVVRMAIATNRIIVTMDRDFAEYFHSAAQIAVGIVYLELSNRRRNVAGITSALRELFSNRSVDFDFACSLVIVSDSDVEVHTR